MTTDPETSNPLPRWPTYKLVEDGPGATKAASELAQNYEPHLVPPTHISAIPPDPDRPTAAPPDPPPEPPELGRAGKAALLFAAAVTPKPPSDAELERREANANSPRAPEVTLSSTPTPDVLRQGQSLRNKEAEEALVKEALKR